MTGPRLRIRGLPPPPPEGEHEVWHRPAGTKKWVLASVLPSRGAAWDFALDLPPGAIQVRPMRPPGPAPGGRHPEFS